MSAVERTAEEVPDIFATDGTKGLSGDSVNMLPKMKITTTNNVDASGEKIGCSVCLQVGLLAIKLPTSQILYAQFLRVRRNFVDSNHSYG